MDTDRLPIAAQPSSSPRELQIPINTDEAVAPAVEPQLRAADHVIDHLVVRERVDVFFGLPGGAISPLDDALHARNDVRIITVRHEADAVFAAAGYARATGKVGVAMVTSGPGVLNALNALASAHLEGLPVLLLAGEAPRARAGQGSLQDGSVHGLDILHVARSMTKVVAELIDPNVALPRVMAVLQAMREGRPGAGLITCPIDVTAARAAKPHVGLAGHRPAIIDEESLDRAAELVASAKRPVLYAGNGVRSGDGPRALRAFAERLQIPVITTPHGKGVFPESHPLALGIFGLALHPSAVEFLDEGFDCIIAVGTSLSELSTGGWSKKLRGPMIQIDIDSSRVGRAFPVDVAVIGPAGAALRSIANRLPPAAPRVFGIRRNSNPEAFPIGPERRITPQRALWELQRAMPATTRYTCDSGEHTLYALHYLTIDDSRCFSIALGLASMASGIGMALGVAAGSPGDPVVAIAGDGGFTMALPAIAAAAHARLPIVFAILNDGRYGMCDIGYAAVYGRTPGFQLGQLDVARTAEGLGARAIRITGPDQLTQLDLAELAKEGPIVLDIQIDREVRMLSSARYEVMQAAPQKKGSN